MNLNLLGAVAFGDINYIIAQILGGIGVFIVGISYFQKKKNQYLILQIISNSFFIAQFAFLGAYSAIFISSVSLIRLITFFIIEKQNKEIKPIHLLIFQIIIIIITIVTYEGIMTVFPAVIASVYGVGVFVKDLRKTYSIGLFNSILWIIFNFSIKAHSACIGNVVELIASIVGLIKMIRYKKNLKIEESKTSN